MLKPEEITLEAERIGGVIGVLAHCEPQRLLEHFARAIERRVLQELEADSAREVARYRRLDANRGETTADIVFCACCGQRKGQ